MKKIVKNLMLVLLALLGLGLAGCSSDYDSSPISGDANRKSYRKILLEIEGGEYEIRFNNGTEVDDFIYTIKSENFGNIESIKKKDDQTAVIKFKDSSDGSSGSSSKIEEKIIEKDGKKYKVTVEEIVENPAEEIAEQAVEETTKSGE